MLQSRRAFLKSTLGGATLLSAGLQVPQFLARSALAAAEAPRGGNVLVVVQLSGGNDGLNTVIPFADEAYARNRIALRIPAEQVLKVNDRIGLHPRMTGLSKQLESGRLAIVQGIGYPNPDRSHFRSMDIWQSARPDLALPEDGWLGRAVDATSRADGGDIPAVNLGGERLPLALMARHTAVPSFESLENFRLRTESGALAADSLRALAQTGAADEPPLVDFLRRSTLAAYDSSRQVQTALSEERTAASYPAFALAGRLKTIAQLIDAGLDTSIYYVSLDGFDTHANQLDAHAGLLGELSDSLAAFMDDLAARGHLDRVTVMTFSEFGRRVDENASAGTDHGAAAPLFLLGGRVRSGTIGDHPSLTDLDEGDLKFHTDFRRIYATLLDAWLGCPSETVLAGRFEPVELLRA
jgi:uncharacterized protein (DUF1501 family)